MNYIYNIQKAIEYIEENLEEEINYEKVAQQIGMSSYYFHRIFSAIIGISPAEYIRNRRLTCAAEDLSRKNYNILEETKTFIECDTVILSVGLCRLFIIPP